jgi:hypothetical protein
MRLPRLVCTAGNERGLRDCNMNAFVRWKKSCLCVEAARLDPQAAPFLFDEHIGLEVRFKLAAAILDRNSDRANDREDAALH